MATEQDMLDFAVMIVGNVHEALGDKLDPDSKTAKEINEWATYYSNRAYCSQLVPGVHIDEHLAAMMMAGEVMQRMMRG